MRGKTPSLQERGHELGEIARLVGESGSSMVIEGPPGIGKTKLLAAAESMASECGRRVLTARGGETELEVPFGIVHQLFAPVLAESGEADPVFDGAASQAMAVLGIPSAAGEPADPEPTATDTAFHGLFWLCANLASRAPLTLVVDDAHWADERSLRWLAYLSLRIEDLPINLLIARRKAEPGSWDLAIDGMLDQDSVTVLKPGLLSAEGSTALVRETLGDAGKELCLACHQVTGGNPYLLVMLTAELAELPEASRDPGKVASLAPEGVAKGALLRLSRSSGTCIPLARAVTIFGREAEVRHAQALAELDEESMSRSVDELIEVGLLAPGTPLRFSHPLIRTSIFEDMSEPRRALLHSRAAGILADEGAADEVVAGQLLEAERNGDPRAAEILLRAGREARSAGATEGAVRFFRRALQEPPPAGQRGAVLTELGAAESRASLPDAIAHLEEAVDLTKDDTGEVRAWMELGRAHLLVADLGKASEAFGHAVALAGDPELKLRLDAELASAEVNFSSALDAADRLAPYRSELAGDTVGQRLALTLLGFSSMQTNEPAEDAAGLALKGLGDGRLLEEQTSVSLTFWEGVMTLLLCDRLAETEQCLDEAIVDARKHGWPFALAMEACLRSWLWLRRGDLKRARAEVESSLRIAELHGTQTSTPISQALLADIQRESGELAEAEGTIREAEYSGDVPEGSVFQILLHSRGHLRLSQARWEEARTDFLENGRRALALGGLTSAALAWRSGAAVAAGRLGDADQAARLADEELEIAKAFGTPRVIGVAERAVALVSPEPEEAIDGLRQAVDSFDAADARLELARTLGELGAALRRANHRKEAREPLKRAIDLASRCGCHPVADRAKEELVAAGGRPRRTALKGPESLTPSELRVAESAARGQSNREIAEDLFVTVRTVEFHLSRAYDKLEIASRKELAAALEAT